MQVERPTRPAVRGGSVSDHRQALATLETAADEDFAAAPGGHAGAKADFAGAFLAVRAKGRLHDFVPLKR